MRFHVLTLFPQMILDGIQVLQDAQSRTEFYR